MIFFFYHAQPTSLRTDLPVMPGLFFASRRARACVCASLLLLLLSLLLAVKPTPLHCLTVGVQCRSSVLEADLFGSRGRRGLESH